MTLAPAAGPTSSATCRPPDTHLSESVTAHSLGTPATDPNFFRNTRLSVVPHLEQ